MISFAYVAARWKSDGTWVGWLSWNNNYLTFSGNEGDDPGNLAGVIPVALDGNLLYTPPCADHRSAYLGGYKTGGYYGYWHDAKTDCYPVTGEYGAPFSPQAGGVIKDTNEGGRYLSVYKDGSTLYSSWETTDGQAVVVEFRITCQTGCNWIQGLPDATTLDRVSIPGTHDSCALYDKDSAGFTQTQWLSITSQLEQGIRFLDLRCKYQSDDDPTVLFPIHHGNRYQNIIFTQVQQECADFLARYPDEFILVNIQQEESSVSDQDYSDRFTALADASLWFLPPIAVPTVQQCRGHMVLLRSNWKFPAKDDGLPWLGWADDANHGINSTAVIITQNDWKWSNGGPKGDLVEQYIDDAAAQQAGSGAKIYLNFLSYSIPPGQSPGKNAEGMNPRIQGYLRDNIASIQPVGVLPLDFSSNTGNPHTGCLEDQIIQHNNFKPGFRYF